MGKDAAQRGPALVQHLADVEERGIAGAETAAVAVGVDLDQDRDGIAGRPRRLGDGRGLLARVQDDGEIAAARPEGEDARELLRRDPDRVEDVPDARGGEDLGLLQGGDGSRAGAVRQDMPRDLDGFRGLQVRAQRDLLISHSHT
jgi:hypothetical protein